MFCLNLNIGKKSSEEKWSPHAGQVKTFSLTELRAATNNFNSKKILGRGGFGVVYKGRLADGSKVAIKRLFKENSTSEGLSQFQTEVKMISRALHRNLLRLYGFCITRKERLLVYPHMVNGSVASRLKGRPESHAPLDWQARKCVAYGTANALIYLHDHCHVKIIHRDVKADNILLNEDFEAVVGDFGLVKFVDYRGSHVITNVCGTFGHIAPEYFTSRRCSEKIDVYGYGILLLELITGKRARDIVPPSEREEGVMLLDWIEKLVKEKNVGLLIDSNLYGHYNYREAVDLIHVAIQCTLHSPEERPQMSNVVKMLEYRSLVGKSLWERKKQLTLDKSELVSSNRERQNQLTLDFSKLVFFNCNKWFVLRDVQQEKIELVGEGSLGSVYKVTFKHKHCIAIKMLKDTTCSADNVRKYLNLMKKVQHPNILGLEAYFCSPKQQILVHDYIPNGSLYAHIHGNRGLGKELLNRRDRLKWRKFLNWMDRLNVMLQAAKGLACIHKEYNTFHGNIRSTNILIDNDGVAFISNFGESILRSSVSVATSLEGYMPPEQKLSQKADVYSFGILLLEVLTGRDPSTENLLEWLPSQLKEEHLSVICVPELLEDTSKIGSKLYPLFELALNCTKPLPEDRPKMTFVYRTIKGYRRIISIIIELLKNGLM